MSTKPLPFHESVVLAIRDCPHGSRFEIATLLELIKGTIIPKGHDKIIKAIDDHYDFLEKKLCEDEIREVKEHLLAQKKMSEQKPSAKS
ncbi:MAG: hypothetical protein WC827_01355 [Candidatus Paceibacterota bacterium]|jgi:hypothetical protein